jgi:DNA-directed RNA polymerase specialized sigma54-like protein
LNTKLFDIYSAIDNDRNQAQRNINQAEGQKEELEKLLNVVGNPAPVREAIRQVEQTIAENFADRGYLDKEASNVADAIIEDLNR